MKSSFAGILMLAGAATLLAESAGGIQWSAPKGWKTQGARPMRAATYSVPAAAGDAEDGECAVFYFGPGQGGGVDDNLKRWIAQFQPPDGKPQIRKQTISGMTVTAVDLSGSYTGAGGPMAASKVSKPGYRLLGAIVEGAEGAVFFKFTGPAKTVAAQQASFEGLLKSIKR